MSATSAIVLAAHGSRSTDANAALCALAASLEHGGAARVYPGFLEMTEPSIAAAIDASIAEGAERVIVVPYFLHPGMHVRRDLTAIVETATAAHPTISIALTDFLGAQPEIADILTQMIATALR